MKEEQALAKKKAAELEAAFSEECKAKLVSSTTNELVT